MLHLLWRLSLVTFVLKDFWCDSVSSYLFDFSYDLGVYVFDTQIFIYFYTRNIGMFGPNAFSIYTQMLISFANWIVNWINFPFDRVQRRNWIFWALTFFFFVFLGHLIFKQFAEQFAGSPIIWLKWRKHANLLLYIYKRKSCFKVTWICKFDI